MPENKPAATAEEHSGGATDGVERDARGEKEESYNAMASIIARHEAIANRVKNKK